MSHRLKECFPDANVFDGYSSSDFASAFGDRLQNDNFFFQQLKYVRSSEEKAALFGARAATKDATVLYATLALPVVVIAGGEVILAEPAIASSAGQFYSATSSGINSLYWAAGEGAHYLNFAGSKVARDIAFKVGLTTAPVLGKTKIGSTVLTEIAWFSHHGSINFINLGEKIEVPLRKAGELLDKR